jgi:hypothetical protein
MLKAEVADLKKERVHRFRRHNTDVRGTVFIEFPKVDGEDLMVGCVKGVWGRCDRGWGVGGGGVREIGPWNIHERLRGCRGHNTDVRGMVVIESPQAVVVHGEACGRVALLGRMEALVRFASLSLDWYYGCGVWHQHLPAGYLLTKLYSHYSPTHTSSLLCIACPQTTLPLRLLHWRLLHACLC